MASDAFISTSVILAKTDPDQTLEDHTQACLEFLPGFIKYFRQSLTRLSKMFNVPAEELESRLFVTVYLHDIGKANKDFQAYIRGGGNSRGIPHPLLSLPFLLAATTPLDGLRCEAIAGISHHTPFSFELYSDYDANLGDYYLWDSALEFYNKLPDLHQRLFHRKYPFELRQPDCGMSRHILKEIHDSIKYAPPEVRDLFVVFAAAVHYCDWLASGHCSAWRYEFPELKTQVLSHIHKLEFESNTFASNIAPLIQRGAAKVAGHMLLSAPTGSGKTEAALLWSSVQPERKLIYLLPTRVTCNALYKRISERYAGNKVGLVHGTAPLIIAEDKGWHYEDYRSEILHSSTFMKPITVATVDQLLLAGFNWTHWEMVEAAQWNANVVFDEIHAYDLYTLALILIACEKLSQDRSSRICLMSATFPRFAYNAFKEVLQSAQDVKPPEGTEIGARHELYCNWDMKISDVANKILPKLQDKKVLVVLNTVDEAVDFYKKVRELVQRDMLRCNCLLFHSRFIERDRRNKEALLEEINRDTKPFIAVTTQVVEVGLDIDFDVLLTQVAPVDALAQRMGRVNRRGLKGKSPVYVFPPDFDKSGKVYGLDTIKKACHILHKFTSDKHPPQLITYEDVLGWIDDQYPESEYLTRLQREAKRLKEELQRFQYNLRYVQTLSLKSSDSALQKLAKTREITLPSLEVVPERFRDIVLASSPIERVNYIVRVPTYLAKERYYDIEAKVLFANLDYSEEFGATGPGD